MNLAQAGLNLDTDDLKQAGNLGLWKAVPKFDAARGMKFLTYAAPAIRNAMMDMVGDAFAAFEQRMVTEDKDGVCYQRVSQMCIRDRYKAGRSLYWERPAVFMLQQARLVELPALSAIPHIHAGLPRC